MDYVGRSKWGARSPTSVSFMSGSLGMAVHWSAGPPNQSVRAIQDFHMDTRGWTDIAYSWLVDVFGTIYEGRGWGRAGAHTMGFNTVVHAVCVIANDDAQIGDAAHRAVSEVIEEHNRRYGAGFVRPHRDFAGASTACPGDEMAQFARTYQGGTDMGLSEEDIRTLAGFEHDTRKLILMGQTRAEEMHREAMVAEWRTRKLVRGDIADISDPGLAGVATAKSDDPDHDLLVAAAGAEFIANEGRKQLRELDEDPSLPVPKS